jgi:hypothetical protein
MGFHSLSMQFVELLFKVIHYCNLKLPANLLIYICTSSRPTRRPSQLLIEWVLGALSPGIKRLGREVYGTFPSNANIRNDGAIIPITPYLHGIVLNK